MGKQAPQNAIRPLASVEYFVEGAHDLFGSLRVVGVYKLTQPTTLENIRHAASYLRARHQILQCSVSFNWNTKAAYYIKADHLALHVDHHADERAMDEYIRQLVDGDFAPDVPDKERQRAWHARCDKYLPWTIALIGRGDYVCFVAPHSICDGVSLDVIGGDMVRALNGQDVKDFLPIVQPVELMFGGVSTRTRVKMFLKLLLQPGTVQNLGLDSSNWSRDWHVRKYIDNTLNVTLQDIAPFFAECRAQNVSLTSGIISTLYEVLGKRPGLTVAQKKVFVHVAMDCRRRVESTSVMPRDQIGAYFGSCKVYEDGAAGEWAERAKRVHKTIHSVSHKSVFVGDALQGEMALKMGRAFCENFVNGKKMGRMYPIGVSNIGRRTRIEKANEECQRLAGDGTDITQIEWMRFDNSHTSVGPYIGITLATVGQNMTVHLGACEPFLSQQVLDEILDSLSERLCRVSDD